MCVICAKPAGVEYPSIDYLRLMWNSNQDGAGFMWNEGGKVHIRKGFMKFSDFKNAFDETFANKSASTTAAVFHFRITTHGGTKPENCHPFPVSGNMSLLQKLKATTTLGVAHNGVINIKERKGTSDTMTYVVERLAVMKKINRNFYKNEHFSELIENSIGGSRMCFLDRSGAITTIGKWITDEHGLLLSNDNFMWLYSSRYGYYNGYGDSDDWDYGEAMYVDHYCYETKEAKRSSTALAPRSRGWGKGGKYDFIPVIDLEMLTDQVMVLYAGTEYYPEDMYVDSKGVVYGYDYETDVLCPFEGASVRMRDGSDFIFDEDISEYFAHDDDFSFQDVMSQW